MVVVNGKVTELLQALVTIRLPSGKEVECLIDTGASCALVLPASLIAELGIPATGDVRDIEMVGGEFTKAALALVEIEWLGQMRTVEVIIRDDYLLGTELLDETTLVIDYRARTVTISCE